MIRTSYSFSSVITLLNDFLVSISKFENLNSERQPL